MVNKALLIGRLGKDPEIHFLENDRVVANMSLATSYKREGEEKRVDWHRIVCYGKTAESCSQYARKGMKVYVEGRIQTRTWDDKEGNRRYTTEIVAYAVKFLDPIEKKETGITPPAPLENAKVPEDEDLPF